MIDYDLLLEISDYAKKHYESSKEIYSQRNQDKNKMFRQIMNGKICEFCVYFFLKAKGYEVTKPDLEIYTHNKKSHDADLIANGKTYLHVKSITKSNYEKYGISFLVEKNDPEVINPQENNFYVIAVQENFLYYKIHSFVASNKIQWGVPRNSKLTTKLAYYENK